MLGGGAYAASQIGAGDIKKNAVRAKHIKKSQVKHLAANSVKTPKLADGAPCAMTGSGHPTGSAADCISRHGVNDMVGNVWERVADWVPALQAKQLIGHPGPLFG